MDGRQRLVEGLGLRRLAYFLSARRAIGVEVTLLDVSQDVGVKV